MIKGSLSEIRHALQINEQGEGKKFTGVSIDTRTLAPGNIYVAICGNQLDGHQFIDDAVSKGAVAIICSLPVKCNIPSFQVHDTTIALGQLAKWWREKFNLPIIGVTGSCGKTTTKQMLGAILNECGKVLISKGNHNNYYGVPLTLFQLNAEHQFAVIEMGADRPGEISYLVDIVQPQIALITNVAPVHIEIKSGIGFRDIKGVFKEKSQIFSRLPNDGTAIINADSPFYSDWQARLKNQSYKSFGFSKSADVRAENLQANNDQCYRFDLYTPEGNASIQLSTMGRHNIENALAAIAAVQSLDVSLDDIKQGLSQIPLAPHRMQRFLSFNDALIIDDSYNANTKSVLAVIDLLASFEGQRILVFADMLELGPISKAEHQKIGEHAKAIGIEYLLAYGAKSQYAVDAFGEGASHFDEQEPLFQALKTKLDANTVVALKGSWGMQLAKLAQRLNISG